MKKNEKKKTKMEVMFNDNDNHKNDYDSDNDNDNNNGDGDDNEDKDKYEDKNKNEKNSKGNHKAKEEEKEKEGIEEYDKNKTVKRTWKCEMDEEGKRWNDNSKRKMNMTFCQITTYSQYDINSHKKYFYHLKKV